MFFTYILKSLKNNKRYVGYTSKELFVRLKEHNSGCNNWTRQNKPFILIYYEQFNNKAEAIKREKFLKSGQGRKYLDEILKNI
jgi:putative endonuclease